ncbi:uncharacterized protein BT62DRAFT_928382, partial [Guyanagaster necrorhizus]
MPFRENTLARATVEEPKPETRSPKRARHTPLSTPELDSDVSSLPSTPLSTPSPVARLSRPTRPLPRNSNKQKPKGNRSNPQKDCDDDFRLGGKPKVSANHRPRGTGHIPCGSCSGMFQRQNDRNRHQLRCPERELELEEKMRCQGCSRLMSRKDALKRHQRTCRKL